MQPPVIQSQIDDEISLVDMLRFLKKALKSIAVAGVAGISLSISYLAITPNQYESVAQISMAQIGATNNNNINPLGVNIEEPVLLIARMSSPTSFTPQVIAACGIQDQPNAALVMSRAIKLTIPKGLANVVELRTFAKGPEEARECSKAVFELIKTSQSQIIAPYIEEAKAKLLDDEERLARAKEIVAKADKFGSSMGAGYLSTRDEIRYLLDEITALKNVVASNQNRATRLIAPIYASDAPIAQKKRLIILVAGLFAGLFLGLLITLVRQLFLRSKTGRA